MIKKKHSFRLLLLWNNFIEICGETMTENSGENANDNVIILGAGASYDAGIPLLGSLVEKMRRYAFKGSSEDGPLSFEDKEVFHKAMEILYKLDEYHGRAAFDDRNIEDILSILSFNTISGGRSSRADFDWMVKAVSRTIELSCKIHSNLDTIGTFNDLV